MARPRSPAPGRARQQGFLDFSFTEIVITFGVALVVLGPKKLPGLVGQIGRWVGRARVMARQFREQLEHEVSAVNEAMDVGAPAPPPAAAAAPPAAAGATGPATPAEATPAVQSFHADSPTHFRLAGTNPAVSFSDPLADSADPAEPARPTSAEPAAPAPAPDAAHPQP